MTPLCRSLIFPKERLPFNSVLHLIANFPSFQDEDLFYFKIMEAIKGGVTCIQLRDHVHDYNTVLKVALRLKSMLKDIVGVSFFVNTHDMFKLAEFIDADGVFLENQISYKEARKRLGEKKIIGVSCKNEAQVRAFAHTTDVDYLSFKISPSKFTCPQNDEIWNESDWQEALSISPHRAVLVGGLDISRVTSLAKYLRYGDGFAMAGGLIRANDVFLEAQRIRTVANNIRGEK